jgi:hypothetical protein
MIVLKCKSNLLATSGGLHGHSSGSQRHVQYVAVRCVHNACRELVTWRVHADVWHVTHLISRIEGVARWEVVNSQIAEINVAGIGDNLVDCLVRPINTSSGRDRWREGHWIRDRVGHVRHWIASGGILELEERSIGPCDTSFAEEICISISA